MLTNMSLGLPKRVRAALRLKLSQPKVRVLYERFRQQSFTLLDVGSGNDSCLNIKKVLPNCRYFGLDRTPDYNMSCESFRQMEAFYQVDLESLNFVMLPDSFFDAIVVTHVIEHLREAPGVLRSICRKLKPGGLVYVEWPHPRSMHLPSMRDSLNFLDDPTHVELWDNSKICAALEEGKVHVLRRGTRRNWWYLALSPIVIPYRAAKRGYISGPDFWDHLGFAQYVLGERSAVYTGAIEFTSIGAR